MSQPFGAPTVPPNWEVDFAALGIPECTGFAQAKMVSSGTASLQMQQVPFANGWLSAGSFVSCCDKSEGRPFITNPKQGDSGIHQDFFGAKPSTKLRFSPSCGSHIELLSIHFARRNRPEGTPCSQQVSVYFKHSDTSFRKKLELNTTGRISKHSLNIQLCELNSLVQE